MMVCKNCLIAMVETMSFQLGERNRHEYCKCPKCKRETKHIKVMNSELTFGEYISKEIQKEGKKND